MKLLLSLILVLCCIQALSAKSDSLICFTKAETITLSNKLRLLQDSLKFKSDVAASQDTLLTLYNKRVTLFEVQLKNRQETILALKRENEIMQEIIVNQQPSWYDNKLLWVGSGVVATVAAILLIK